MSKSGLALTTPNAAEDHHPPPPYLEEFKKHVVEVGGDIDHVNWLFGVGCCWGSQDQGSGNCQEVTIQHSLTQHLAPSTQPPIYPPTICRAIHLAFIHPAIHSFGVHSTMCPYSIHHYTNVHPSTRSPVHPTTISTSTNSSIYPSSIQPSDCPSTAHLFRHPSFFPSTHSFIESRSTFHLSTVCLAPSPFKKYLSGLYSAY